ncbi:uncharacterized protein [Cherax quadricarinatus]|uniref:uncharacterized protein n=1 Tax=Cherax quadricarinatus TaxID=27406 RepID=UPI00387E42FA
MKMRPLIFLSVLVVLVATRSIPGMRRTSGALEVIRRLGESPAGQMKVIQGRPLAGESPIYTIRLRPTPYYYIHNVLTSVPTLPRHKVDVGFINNGKPQKVYHWNPPLKAHIYRTSSPPTMTSKPFRPTTEARKSSKSPWLTLKKYYVSNGKPSRVYVWKDDDPATNKYRHVRVPAF